ncbi:MFS transporter, partial [Microvirga sp. Mcv34]|uniref:MFS transporter n=1 Tax=Microvirga sp. Mcv34 TaxID=2926016 RepID=UPI0021C8B7D7
MLTMQATSAFLSRLIPTLAPILMAELGWSETEIGYLTALNTVGSILFLLSGAPLMRRTGSIRALQIGLSLGVVGVLVLTVPVAGAAVLGAMLIGLGYGPSTPAGSDVLQRYAPARHRNLIFSIKQAGVPIGGVLAGVSLPVLADWAGWRMALAFATIVALLTVAAVQSLRERVDAERNRDLRLRPRLFLSLENLRRPLAFLRAAPDLKRLAFVGACLAIGQGSWFAFLVTYLVTKLGLTLPQAGLIFAVMQATGIVGRVALGWVSDRIGLGIVTLRLVTIASAASSLVLAATGPNWPMPALLTLAAIAGVTVSSWNGVQIAEIARLSPRAHVSETTAGTTILIFVGYVVGPSAFAALVTSTGRF